MRKIFMIISAVLCNLLGCTAQQQNFESLDVEAFEKVISDTSVVRLDVRSIDEYASGHIAKAINIDVMKDDFTTKATSLLPKDKTIALYCRSGRRSKKAAGILVENGYKVIELNSGISGWINAQKDIVR
ncbi:MAG: rhodanese-like domain-containing protein [Prevotella sp.]|nr:rhodanese-like domain-containing protein [Prevotella sp.]MCI7578847.1 rhodanese-like domain-containing protein [Prevotella sp.]MDY3253591.1 rhodanese-like domain-containing protein [Prevotella sp.]MDY4555431.1 rhodanese-like domain-containing protein [Prevotella sp.]